MSQVREIFTRLLRDPAPSPERIAEEVTRVLRRNEEARIYHWHQRRVTVELGQTVYLDQSSTASPGTFWKSRTLRVTTVPPC